MTDEKTVDPIESIIDMAMSYEVEVEKPDPSMRMQKFTISESTYNQLECMKLKSGLQLKELMPLLIDAAFSVKELLDESGSEGPRRKWFVTMDPDVRVRLDELCNDSGVSASKMIDSIVKMASSTQSNTGEETGKNDLQSLVSSWGVASE